MSELTNKQAVGLGDRRPACSSFILSVRNGMTQGKLFHVFWALVS